MDAKFVRLVKIVLAPDSFKGSLPAPRVARALADGLARVWPGADCVFLPVADGGEGTAETLADSTGGRLFRADVAGALPTGTRVSARWARLGGAASETAVVEMAQAVGLASVAPKQRDVRRATTRGVGEMILAALCEPSVTRLIVGLGGTATNDGGAGLLRALGVGLLDDAGREVPEAAGVPALASVAALDVSGLRLDPACVADVLLACDVDNPLCGPRGASAVFGPQKGASPDDVVVLDNALARWGAVLGRTPSPGRTTSVPVADAPGAGAAGGALAALLWLFPQARVQSGIDVVLDAARFEEHLSGADLVLTGEGRLDAQTLGGKAVVGVARRAWAAGVPCAALVGSLDPALNTSELAARGLVAILPIAPGPCTLPDALAFAESWIADGAERAARWLGLGRALALNDAG